MMTAVYTAPGATGADDGPRALFPESDPTGLLGLTHRPTRLVIEDEGLVAYDARDNRQPLPDARTLWLFAEEHAVLVRGLAVLDAQDKPLAVLPARFEPFEVGTFAAAHDLALRLSELPKATLRDLLGSTPEVPVRPPLLTVERVAFAVLLVGIFGGSIWWQVAGPGRAEERSPSHIVHGVTDGVLTGALACLATVVVVRAAIRGLRFMARRIRT